MSVVEAVLSFDGTRVEALRVAAECFEPREAEALAELCDSDAAATRIAATWIVKALCERGEAGALDMAHVFGRLETETEWEVLLHLLQSVQFAPGQAAEHRDRILLLLGHDKTLVRVWALDAFVRIAMATGDGLGEACELVEASLSAPKASQRARARQLAQVLGM